LKIDTTNPPGNEDLGKIHGIDERISEENMIKGTEVFIDIVRKLCKI
jgi:acetylornithine deacetylase/succinyl-diaminopimelate desuccinylase-like protein